MIQINSFKFRNAGLLLLFYVLLSFLHFYYIIDFQDFNYVAFYDHVKFSFQPIRYFVGSFVIIFLVIFLAIIKMTDFIYAILVLILFFFVIPSALVFSSGQMVYPEIFILHTVFFLSVYSASLIVWNIKTPSLNSKLALTILFTCTLVGIIPFIIEYGPYINLKNLLLIDIYNTRSLVSGNISNWYTAYTYSWFSKIIIPILVVLSLYYRKHVKLLVSIAVLLFLFLCGAHKMVFAGLILLLIFYKHGFLKKTRYFLGAMVGLLTVSIAASLVFGYDYLWDITFRRALMLTALLDYCYVDFFKESPIYWSNSFMSGFMEYPYELSPDHMIGKKYFNRPEVNANIGIISDGFKNLGLFGSLINIFIVSAYISVLNTLKISPKFFGLFVLLIFSFLNSSLTTILLTHGGIVLLLLSIFVLRNTQEKMRMD